MSTLLSSLKTGFKIYLRAQAAYALITLPSLLLPFMYLISELLALAWGTTALLLFLPVLPIVRATGLRTKPVIVGLMLVAGLIATFWAVWEACLYMEENKPALDSMLEWWPFPAIAFVSVVYAVLREHKSLGATGAHQVIRDEKQPAPSVTSSYYPPV